ncbi:MAG: hypothetical protein AAFN65_01530 [Bacteroidota bacterium]
MKISKFGKRYSRVSPYGNTGRLTLLMLVFLSSLVGCSDPNEPLYGPWSAVSADRITGDSMRLDPAEVGFEFDSNGIYTYYSTLGYQEAGRYERQGNKLIATDTTQSTPVEREAIIELLTQDSLHLRWQNQGEELVVKMVKRLD